jgi:hypothetical protein
MGVKILFRKTLAEEGEFEIAKQYFDVIESRADIEEGDFVIGRYSVLPYFRELERDVKRLGGKLVNSILNHQYVADLQNWYYDFEDLTPKTWFRLEDVPSDATGSFVLKGAINSRKQLWRTHMFAPTRNDITDVYFRLMDDSLIQHQGVYIRQYEDFVRYGVNDITGCPISKEFRIFVYNRVPITKGFYWSVFEEEVEADVNDIPEPFIQDIVRRVAWHSEFYIVDVAETIDGRWRVVEFGDAQMGGLSCCDPHKLYSGLKEQVEKVRRSK